MKREYHTPFEVAQHGRSQGLSDDRGATDPDDIERRLIFYLRNSPIDDLQITEATPAFIRQLKDGESYFPIDQTSVPDRHCEL